MLRYAAAHSQPNLTDDEVRFVARYLERVREILAITPQSTTRTVPHAYSANIAIIASWVQGCRGRLPIGQT